MLKNVTLFLHRLVNVYGDDGESQGPRGKVEDHRLIMVKQHGGDALSTCETEPMTKKGCGLLDTPAKLSIGVAALNVPLVIVIREEWAIGHDRMADARVEEFGKRRPRG